MNRSTSKIKFTQVTCTVSLSFPHYGDTRHAVGLPGPRMGWQIWTPIVSPFPYRSVKLNFSLSPQQQGLTLQQWNSYFVSMEIKNQIGLHIHFNKHEEFQLLLFPSSKRKPFPTKGSATLQRQLCFLLPAQNPLTHSSPGLESNQPSQQLPPWAEWAVVATSPTLPQWALRCMQSHPKWNANRHSPQPYLP